MLRIPSLDTSSKIYVFMRVIKIFVHCKNLENTEIEKGEKIEYSHQSEITTVTFWCFIFKIICRYVFT